MLEKYGLLGAKPYSIPMEVNLKIGYTNENVFPNPTLYREMVGKLMYITLTDQALDSVHVLSQLMNEPSYTHLDVGYRMLKYLKNTLGQGLLQILK